MRACCKRWWRGQKQLYVKVYNSFLIQEKRRTHLKTGAINCMHIIKCENVLLPKDFF